MYIYCICTNIKYCIETNLRDLNLNGKNIRALETFNKIFTGNTYIIRMGKIVFLLTMDEVSQTCPKPQ